MQSLLLGWVFVSFLQGMGGFGVPVAVVAPLLVGLGFGPVQAVVIDQRGQRQYGAADRRRVGGIVSLRRDEVPR